MLYLVALFILPYLTFVFFGEGVNPLTKPRLYHVRSKWHYGRRMAAAVICALLVFIVLVHQVGMNLLGALLSAAMTAFVLGMCISAGRMLSAIRDRRERA